MTYCLLFEKIETLIDKSLSCLTNCDQIMFVPPIFYAYGLIFDLICNSLEQFLKLSQYILNVWIKCCLLVNKIVYHIVSFKQFKFTWIILIW